MQERRTKKIGLVGLGLIGGSIAKRLAQTDYSLVAIAHSDETFQKAESLKIFSTVSKDLEAVNGCDIIFVATPIHSINIIFQKLKAVITQPCIVTDVASIKGEIASLAEKTFDDDIITFIPGHPMAGTEFRGIDNAFPDLFEGARWVLCPTNPQKQKHLITLSRLIQALGANTVFSNPQQHDMAVALISHMPLLASMSVFDSVNSMNDLCLKEICYYLAASGFRDTTRIAGTNPELSYDMIKFNQENVLKAVEMLESSLNRLKEVLNGPQEEAMDVLEEIAQARRSLYSEFGQNVFKGLSG